MPYLREATDLQRKIGNDPIALADCLISLANCDCIEFSEAMPLLQETHALLRQNLKPNHPKIASIHDLLGQLSFLHGDAAEAEVAIREAVALLPQDFRPAISLSASTRRTLVESIVLQKKWDEAEVVARDAVPYSPDGIDWDLLGRINAYRGRWDTSSRAVFEGHRDATLPSISIVWRLSS